MFYSASRVYLALIVWLFACTSVVHAATITVMQDGTGDFELIQSALDVAASGDTILIGPGEYLDSLPSEIPGYAWDVDVFAFIRVAELTIIGAGALETIIGPSEYAGINATYSPQCVVWLDGSVLSISGVSLRGCYAGIHATNAPIEIENCQFIDNRLGIIWATQGSGGTISNSHFESSIPGSNGLSLLGSGSNIVVKDCLFDGAMVSIKNLDSIAIRNCEIRNTVVGLQVDSGTHCFVEGCRFYNCMNVGVGVLGPGSICDVEDSEVSGGGSAVYVGSSCQFNATQTHFHGGYWSVIEFANGDPSIISNCHIFPDDGPAIRSFRHPSYGEVVHDLRNNFWGITDGDEIRSLILDGTNNPDNASIVLFEPFIGGPVPTQRTTLDGLKAYFR